MTSEVIGQGNMTEILEINIEYIEECLVSKIEYHKKLEKHKKKI